MHGFRHRGKTIVKTRGGPGDKLLLVFVVFATGIVPITYIVRHKNFLEDWYNLAQLPDYPAWCLAIGSVILLFSLWLNYRAHADLGANWSPRLIVRKQHVLVTDGVFRYVRHPLYSSFVLFGIGQLFLVSNWFVAPLWLASTLALFIWRVPREERLMVEAFGDDYLAYCRRTDRIIPHLRSDAAS